MGSYGHKHAISISTRIRLRCLAAGVLATIALLTVTALPAEASWDPSMCNWHKSVLNVRKYGDFSAWRLREAIDEWNAVSAGQPKLRLVSTGIADVTVRKVSGSTLGYTGTERHECGTAGAYNSQVKINTAGGPPALEREFVTLHELGHSLGLGHSFGEASVMCYCYPYRSQHSKPTATDVRRLRDLN